MEKQITTVYVPTNELPQFIVKDITHGFIKARVTEEQAYLYTPEEHAAVQGYHEALEEVIELWEQGMPLDSSTVNKCKAALSKAEDTHVSDIHVGNIPSNGLDELERWVNSNWQYQHMIIYPKDDLLAKIKELKTITT